MMVVEQGLRELCKGIMNCLYELKEQSLISDKELESHLKKKLEFLKVNQEKLKS